MKIQVNTDSSVKGDERLESIIEDLVSDKLNRFRNDLTRVEVHIRDENADKGGSDDHRCAIEARLRGLDPVAVTHNDADVERSATGAVNKLRRKLSRILDKRNEHR